MADRYTSNIFISILAAVLLLLKGCFSFLKAPTASPLLRFMSLPETSIDPSNLQVFQLPSKSFFLVVNCSVPLLLVASQCNFAGSSSFMVLAACRSQGGVLV